jgi:hypothetical protein
MVLMKYLRTVTFLLIILVLPGGVLLLAPKAFRAIRRMRARQTHQSKPAKLIVPLLSKKSRFSSFGARLCSVRARISAS